MSHFNFIDLEAKINIDFCSPWFNFKQDTFAPGPFFFNLNEINELKQFLKSNLDFQIFPTCMPMQLQKEFEPIVKKRVGIYIILVYIALTVLWKTPDISKGLALLQIQDIDFTYEFRILIFRSMNILNYWLRNLPNLSPNQKIWISCFL